MKQAVQQIKPQDVYLISSTLHFFWAYMLASKFRQTRDSHLIVIDQYTQKPLLMLAFLNPKNSPFASVNELNGREMKGLEKLQNRRHQFDWIKRFIADTPVDKVFIGNDRSVIGQYFIRHSKHKNRSVISCYLDDGVYSYLGREASKNWGERIIDASLKKLAYGLWYDVPPTVGASKWVDQVWVMYPEYVNAALKQKEKIEILPRNEGFSALNPLSVTVLQGAGVKVADIEALDVFITLPNETVFSKIDGYTTEMRRFVSSLVAEGKKVAIKYHPAAGTRDSLNLEKIGALKLPANVSFELFIPFLKNCHVLGDFSTTVLVAHYSENIMVKMMDISPNKQNTNMIELCENLNIKRVQASANMTV